MGEAIPHLLQGALGAIEKKQERERQEELSKLILSSLQDRVIKEAQPAIEPSIVGVEAYDIPKLNQAFNVMHGIDVPFFDPIMSKGREAQPAVMGRPTSTDILTRLVEGAKKHPLTKTIPVEDLIELTKTITGLEEEDKDTRTNDIKNYEYAVRVGMPEEEARRKFLGSTENKPTSDIQNMDYLTSTLGLSPEEAMDVVYKTKTTQYKKYKEYKDILRENPNMPEEDKIALDKMFGINRVGDRVFIKGFNYDTGQEEYTLVDKTSPESKKISVAPLPPKESQEFMAYMRLPDEMKERFKEYTKISEDTSFHYYTKTDTNGVSTLMGVNKKDPTDIRVFDTTKVPKTMTEENKVRQLSVTERSSLGDFLGAIDDFIENSKLRPSKIPWAKKPKILPDYNGILEEAQRLGLDINHPEIIKEINRKLFVDLEGPNGFYENFYIGDLTKGMKYWKTNPDGSRGEYIFNPSGADTPTGRKSTPIIKKDTGKQTQPTAQAKQEQPKQVAQTPTKQGDYSTKTEAQLIKLVADGDVKAVEEAIKRGFIIREE